MVEARELARDWQRREELAAAMVDFLEGWVVRDLCVHFHGIAEALYSDTVEHRLIEALQGADGPLSLAEIAARCVVSKDLLYPGGRLRRALERMEKLGMIENLGGDERPRYCLDRSNLKVRLIAKVFEKAGPSDGLVALTLREGIGPNFD